MSLLFAYLQTREPASIYKFLTFSTLLVSQFNLQDEFIRMIRCEAEHAKAGHPAKLVMKLNNLQERRMIDELYKASQAGVDITLIIRSICCLVSGIKGLSERIRIIRIVDRYLEHARIFYAENKGQNEVYMGSADWMNRNLHRRIEVCFPVIHPQLKQEPISLLKIQSEERKGSVYITDEYEMTAMKNIFTETAQEHLSEFILASSSPS